MKEDGTVVEVDPASNIETTPVQWYDKWILFNKILLIIINVDINSK